MKTFYTINNQNSIHHFSSKEKALNYIKSNSLNIDEIIEENKKLFYGKFYSEQEFLDTLYPIPNSKDWQREYAKGERFYTGITGELYFSSEKEASEFYKNIEVEEDEDEKYFEEVAE